MGSVSVTLPVLTLEGSARARGRGHGEALRSLIHEYLDRWRADIARDLGVDPTVYLHDLVAANDFLPAVRRWAPDLLEELAGLAEGAGLDFETALARQLADEDYWTRLGLKYGSATGHERCSALGAVGQPRGSAWIAQNMDLPAFWDGSQALLHIRAAEDLEILVFTTAGQLGLCGMNSRGVGLCCNTILQCSHSRSGLPEVFVVRCVLELATAEMAENFIRSVPHASPQNYLVGDPERVIDLEVSASQVSRWEPWPGAQRLVHTNHPLKNDDQSQWHAMLAGMAPADRDAFLVRTTTFDRCAALEHDWLARNDPVTMDQMRVVLSGHAGGVCRHGGVADVDAITFGCAIMQLAPTPSLWLAPGPPCSTDFTAYRLSAP